MNGIRIYIIYYRGDGAIITIIGNDNEKRLGPDRDCVYEFSLYTYGSVPMKLISIIARARVSRPPYNFPFIRIMRTGNNKTVFLFYTNTINQNGGKYCPCFRLPRLFMSSRTRIVIVVDGPFVSVALLRNRFPPSIIFDYRENINYCVRRKSPPTEHRSAVFSVPPGGARDRLFINYFPYFFFFFFVFLSNVIIANVVVVAKTKIRRFFTRNAISRECKFSRSR